MVYGARSDDELAFRDQLAGALGSRLAVAVDARGERIDVAGEIARLAPQGEAYVCGPVPLLNLVRKCWAEAGRDPTRLRYETFGNSGRYAPEPFWVRVPDQGAEGRAVELAVAPDQTLLDALIDAGVDVMYDCRRGECGLCAVNVLQVDGEIDHRDVFFSDEERAAGRKLCACVSRVVHGGIVVDAGYRDDGRRFA
jgi:vanillate O-demethylase ferredoxin subunit